MNMNLIALSVVALLFAGHVVAQEIPTKEDQEAEIKALTKVEIKKAKPEYSPYVDQNFPNRVFWGDTHHHSNFSFDDGLMGTKLTPEESYRFARGEEVISNTGLRAKLSRPLDFLVVSDHAEFIGLADMLNKADPALLATPTGKRWYDMMRAGGREATARRPSKRYWPSSSAKSCTKTTKSPARCGNA